MVTQSLNFIRHYWRWFPLWSVLALAVLSMIATLPFSDYYLYPLSQFTSDLWRRGFDLLTHPETLLMLVILFTVMLFTAKPGAASRGIVLGYIAVMALFACVFTLFAPVMPLLSDNQPGRIEVEGRNKHYMLDTYISASDGTYYTLHVCDSQRILCRRVARIRSDTYYSIFVDEPQVDVALNVTTSGVEVVELGEVIYTYYFYLDLS